MNNRLFFAILILLIPSLVKAQTRDEKKKDPTRASDVIAETQKKIRQVEQFDRLKKDFDLLTQQKASLEKSLNNRITALKTEKQASETRLGSEIEMLREENRNLKEKFNVEIASLQKMIQEIKAEKTRKTSVKLPMISVRSKAIKDGAESVVTLEIDGTTTFFKEGETTKINLPGGEIATIQIKEISRNLVEIHFPDFERTLALR